MAHIKLSNREEEINRALQISIWKNTWRRTMPILVVLFFWSMSALALNDIWESLIAPAHNLPKLTFTQVTEGSLALMLAVVVIGILFNAPLLYCLSLGITRGLQCIVTRIAENEDKE